MENGMPQKVNDFDFGVNLGQGLDGWEKKIA
jgi:hypothetical protein